MGVFLEGPRNLTVRRTYFENLNLRNYSVLSLKRSLFDFFYLVFVLIEFHNLFFLTFKCKRDTKINSFVEPVLAERSGNSTEPKRLTTKL